MKNIKKLLLPVLFMTMLLAACSSPTLPEISTTPNTDSQEKSEEVAIYTNPLTGETLESKPENARPFAVMINNVSVALPHCGTSQADILYEVLAEGDITRMLAIFPDVKNVEKIGSVRSARPYYIDIVLSYDAIYINAGGSEQAYSDLANKGVDNLDGVRETFKSDVFYRDSSRMSHGTEHSLFTSGKGILAGCEEKSINLMHEDDDFDYSLSFAQNCEDISMTDSVSAANVSVSFGGLKNTYLNYDSSSGLYSAEEYNNTIIDGNNNEPLEFKNILVLFADTEILDKSGRRSVELFGEGNGKFICNGKSVDITWEHDNETDCFRYLTNGMELILGVGKTYIAIVPTGSIIGLS